MIQNDEVTLDSINKLYARIVEQLIKEVADLKEQSKQLKEENHE